MKGIAFIDMVFMDEITLNFDRGYRWWHKHSVRAYWRRPYAAFGVNKNQSELLDMTQTETRSFLNRCSGSARFVQLRQSLFCLLDNVSPFVDALMRFIARFRDKDGSELDIELAVCEALVNAMVHGNKLDPGKRVYVTCRCGMDGEVCISIQDEGPGFDPDCVPDPTAPENLLLTSSHGIYLMKMLMDEVSFQQCGSVVQMRKKPNDSSKDPRGSALGSV